MPHVQITRELIAKWQPVLDSPAPIKDITIRNNLLRLLENQVNIGAEMHETPYILGEGADGSGIAAAGSNATSVRNWDPILIQLVRRTQPSLIANQLVGVQPMSGPTGLIFALKTHSTTSSGVLAQDLYGPGKTPDPFLGGSTVANPAQNSMTTAEAEALAVSRVTDATSASTAEPVVQESPWAEMSFTIDQSSVTAKTKALKARYTVELAHDLRQIHGLDADTELANILSGELTAELNRELIGVLFSQAIESLARTATFVHASAGGFDFYNYQNKVAVDGVYNLAVDSDGRWEQEHFKNLVAMVNRVAHEVALGTRRGLGNIIVTDPITASAIDSASRTIGTADNPGGLDFNHDNVGVTFAGRLLNRYDVFVDPYRATQEILVGYRGSSAFDAGYFYAPYVPLTVMRTIGEEDMQPRIGFKTRYGLAPNPFVSGNAGENFYFRKFTVSGV